jgi:hypothetical protein
MANTIKYCPTLYTVPPKTADSGARFDFRTIELLTTDLLTTKLIAMAVLPAGHRLVHFELESDKLDDHTTTTVTVTAGILNSNYNEAEDAAPALISSSLLSASTTPGRLGGRVYSALAFSEAIGVDYDDDRIIAITFGTAPATAKAGTLSVIIGIDQD